MIINATSWVRAMQKIVKIVCITVLLLLVPQVSFADDIYVIEGGIALSGYDAVSFFDAKPVKGRSKHSYTYNGGEYFFSSAKNLATFRGSPDKYTPQYGGFCSYGVSLGKKFAIDPLAYDVQDGKLYLLLNGATKNIWEKDKSNNIIAADKSWLIISNIKLTSE